MSRSSKRVAAAAAQQRNNQPQTNGQINTNTTNTNSSNNLLLHIAASSNNPYSYSTSPLLDNNNNTVYPSSISPRDALSIKNANNHNNNHLMIISSAPKLQTKDRNVNSLLLNTAHYTKARKMNKQKVCDFAKLDMSSLLRYKRHFHLTCPPNASKNHLIQICSDHFSSRSSNVTNTATLPTQPLRDIDVISAFLHTNAKFRSHTEKDRTTKDKK